MGKTSKPGRGEMWGADRVMGCGGGDGGRMVWGARGEVWWIEKTLEEEKLWEWIRWVRGRMR